VTNVSDCIALPSGVATASDGSLLVTDDASRTIWRVSYTGKK
jgi:glucose/arabinose dehydrogenase